MIFQAFDDSMNYSFPRCSLKVYKIKKNSLTLESASILKHTDRIWLPCGSVTSSAMMEKKAFSSSMHRVFSFLMYSATTSITSFWMIIDVYTAHSSFRSQDLFANHVYKAGTSVESGDLMVRAPACRSRGRWLDSTSAVSKLGQFRSPHFARVFRKKH